MKPPLTAVLCIFCSSIFNIAESFDSIYSAVLTALLKVFVVLAAKTNDALEV